MNEKRFKIKSMKTNINKINKFRIKTLLFQMGLASKLYSFFYNFFSICTLLVHRLK